jgi:hypothetical protein
VRAASRSKLAGRLDQALATALSGNAAAPLTVTAAELLSEPIPTADVITANLDKPETGLLGQWRVRETFVRSGLHDQLLNSLVSPDAAVRAAAARLCGALRMTEAVQWIGDLLRDASPMVRDAAVRSLGRLGGARAVDVLVGAADQLPLYRLAPALAEAASDVQIEELMRKPPSERAAVGTLMACGLRRDILRVPPLLGIAHDRRWPRQVRIASCHALTMIGDPASTGGLRGLADGEPDPAVKAAAERAHRRLIRSVGRAWK